MKPVGEHRKNVLTPLRVKNITEPGRYGDGNGLYLIVDDSGARRWVLRIVVHGRRRDMGLGSARLVTLAEARDKAQQYRRMARDGGDPTAEKRKAATVSPTFEKAARTVHGEHSPAWKNAKHAAQWLSTLTEYAFPAIGARRVDQIETADVLRVLAPIWLVKPETARRVRQRLKTVFDWAKAAGHRSGDNPVEGVERGLPRQPDKSGHHSALPYAEVPAFIASLQEREGDGELARLAFEFLILTATRTGEVIGAKRTEVDADRTTWTVPAERMKAGREHRVPLSDRARQILARAAELSGDSPYLFPSLRSPDKPMSNMVFLMLLRRMGSPATAHGFRSAFRDWAAERTNFPHEVAEMALAHAIRDKTEAAYRRGDLFDKRRRLMDAWSAYATAAPAKVVHLSQGQRRA